MLRDETDRRVKLARYKSVSFKNFNYLEFFPLAQYKNFQGYLTVLFFTSNPSWTPLIRIIYFKSLTGL